MAKILFGIPVREKIRESLIDRVKKLGLKPCLVIVQVGDRDDSNIYIRNKIKFGESLGIKVILEKFESSIEESVLVEKIKKISDDKSVNGIIVQLPLPESINSNKIIQVIPKDKDADGLSTVVEFGGSNLVTPATARAVISIFDFYNIKVLGKKIAVIGRSRLAGGPIAQSLQSLGAEVSVCHKETENTKEICKNSDIIISAAGQLNLVNKDFVKASHVVVDVGINKTLDGKLVGDVDFAEVEPIVDSITPVPGGIGPLTVACLFENLLYLVENKT